MNAMQLPPIHRLAYLRGLLEEGRTAEVSDILRQWQSEAERGQNHDALTRLIQDAIATAKQEGELLTKGAK